MSWVVKDEQLIGSHVLFLQEKKGANARYRGHHTWGGLASQGRAIVLVLWPGSGLAITTCAEPKTQTPGGKLRGGSLRVGVWGPPSQ